MIPWFQCSAYAACHLALIAYVLPVNVGTCTTSDNAGQQPPCFDPETAFGMREGRQVVLMALTDCLLLHAPALRHSDPALSAHSSLTSSLQDPATKQGASRPASLQTLRVTGRSTQIAHSPANEAQVAQRGGKLGPAGVQQGHGRRAKRKAPSLGMRVHRNLAGFFGVVRALPQRWVTLLQHFGTLRMLRLSVLALAVAMYVWLRMLLAGDHLVRIYRKVRCETPV